MILLRDPAETWGAGLLLGLAVLSIVVKSRPFVPRTVVPTKTAD